jgi:AcrR family transcriptional regulator
MTSKQKIIHSCIEVIEKDGIQSVTVRKVAKAAHVNVAAINYYFGSKDKLLTETLHDSMHSAFSDWNEVVGKTQKKLDAQLKTFFIHWMAGIINYPNLTKAHLYDPIVNENYRGLFVSHFNAFLKTLQDKIKKDFPKMTTKQINLTIMQIISAIGFAALAPKLFKSLSGIDLEDGKTQKEYVNHLINSFIKNYNFVKA